jgi:hypothetical protein
VVRADGRCSTTCGPGLAFALARVSRAWVPVAGDLPNLTTDDGPSLRLFPLAPDCSLLGDETTMREWVPTKVRLARSRSIVEHQDDRVADHSSLPPGSRIIRLHDAG